MQRVYSAATLILCVTALAFHPIARACEGEGKESCECAHKKKGGKCKHKDCDHKNCKHEGKHAHTHGDAAQSDSKAAAPAPAAEEAKQAPAQ